MLNDERILRTLRMQAWERAKGELQSILQTYWDGSGKDNPYRDAEAAIAGFIKNVEDEGIIE